MSDNQSEQAAQQGNGQLGHVVSWQVPSEVSLVDLRRALARAGLGQELAADMAPRNALCRGLREMKTGRVIRQLRREGDLLYFQFTAEHLSKREATYNKEAELTLNVETGVVWCSVGELQREATQLLNEHLQKRLTTDLTRLVQRVYEARRADLIPIRPQGGVYFVPDMHREVVEKTRLFLKEIGGKLTALAIKLGSSETSADVADSLSDYLGDLIKEFRESCADVSKESRGNVVTSRQGRVKELRQKLSCYQCLLSGYAGAINKQIQEAERELLENLKRSTAPKPEDKPVVQKMAFTPLAEPSEPIPTSEPLAGVGV